MYVFSLVKVTPFFPSSTLCTNQIHKSPFSHFQQKVHRGFQSLINVFVALSLIEQVNFAISANSVIFTIYSTIAGISGFFQFGAYNNLAAIAMYENTPPSVFSSR